MLMWQPTHLSSLHEKCWTLSMQTFRDVIDCDRSSCLCRIKDLWICVCVTKFGRLIFRLNTDRFDITKSYICVKILLQMTLHPCFNKVNVDIDFDHCVVQCDRKWLQSTWWNSNWFCHVCNTHHVFVFAVGNRHFWVTKVRMSYAINEDQSNRTI